MRKLIVLLSFLIATAAKAQVMLPTFAGWQKAASVAPPQGLRYEAESYDAVSGAVIATSTDDASSYQVGTMAGGNWVQYNYINAPSAGTYNVRYRVLSIYDPRTWKIQDAGAATIGTLTIPKTTTFTTLTGTINLAAGMQSIKIVGDTTGGSPIINWFEIDGLLPTGEPKIVRLNFGDQFTSVPDLWNKLAVSDATLSTGTYSQSLLRKRTATPYSLSILSAWNTGGGPTPTEGAGVFPNNVLGRSWKFDNGDQLKVIMDATKTYTVYILSNSQTYQAATVSFTVNGQTTAQKAAAANYGNSATYPDWTTDPALLKLTGVAPNGSGEVIITCNLISGTNGGQLNAMIFVEE